MAKYQKPVKNILQLISISKPTRGGVYLIDASPLVVEYLGFEFAFSSELYLNKFIDRIVEFIEQRNIVISQKYQCDIDLTELWCILLYAKIEKRGFKVTREGITWTNLNQVKLLGNVDNNKS